MTYFSRWIQKKSCWKFQEIKPEIKSWNFYRPSIFLYKNPFKPICTIWKICLIVILEWIKKIMITRHVDQIIRLKNKQKMTSRINRTELKYFRKASSFEMQLFFKKAFSLDFAYNFKIFRFGLDPRGRPSTMLRLGLGLIFQKAQWDRNMCVGGGGWV